MAPQLYLQLVRDGSKLPGESSFYSTFTGPAVYTEAKKYHKVEFSDIDKGKADIDKEATNGYVAMVQHYFASAWILPDGVKRELFVRKVDTNLYAVGMIAPLAADRARRQPGGGGEVLRRPAGGKAARNHRARAWNWSRTTAGSPSWPSRCTGCSTSCTTSCTTGAGRSWRWC